MISVNITLGQNLSSEELEIINRLRQKEFGPVSIVAPQIGNPDWDRPYFLVKDNIELVAFGRLHQTITLDFHGAQYRILGIGSIVTIVRGRGYGRKLMAKMKHYIQESCLIAIGFCPPEISTFYTKCGYQILPSGVNRFQFIGKDGQELPPDHTDDDVLYLEDGGLMTLVKQYPNDRVVVHHTPW